MTGRRSQFRRRRQRVQRWLQRTHRRPTVTAKAVPVKPTPATKASSEHPWALIMWHMAGTRATMTFHRTHADAQAWAPCEQEATSTIIETKADATDRMGRPRRNNFARLLGIPDDDER